MGAIADLWKSERGLIAVILIVSCTVLAAMATITADQWIEYTKWIFITYAAAKTVTGVTQIVKGGTADPETAPPAAPTPVPPPAGGSL